MNSKCNAPSLWTLNTLATGIIYVSNDFVLFLLHNLCITKTTKIKLGKVHRHHKAHLHWQKQKSKKPGFFVVPFTLPEKPITFGVFGTKSACAKKPESHTCVLVSGAHARLLSTFDRTRVVRITSRAAVGWFRWRSRTTWPKTRIIPCEIGAGVYIGKKTVKFRRSFKKSRCGGGFFDSFFFGVFRGSCLATFNEKPECEKDSGFFMPV